MDRPEFRAVILDMDGLMLDTEVLSRDTGIALAAEYGVVFDADLYRGFIGRTLDDIRSSLNELYGAEFPAVEFMARWEADMADALRTAPVPLKPGLSELLAHLEAARLPRAVATSTTADKALEWLAAAGIAPRFHAIITGEQVPRGKPEPDIFLEAAARLRVPPEACLVLEDSEHGVRGAHAAGMTVVMVPDLAPPSAEAAALTHLVLEDLHAVRAWLAGEPR
jgi:HAD superfamily hydrolase (TIGR01509 family)